MMPTQEQIVQSVNVLRDGLTILIEGSSLYLCCDATNSIAIKSLRSSLEELSHSSPLVFVSNFTMLEGYIPQIPESAYQIMELSDTPSIIEFEEHRNLSPEAQTADGTVFTVLIENGMLNRLINRFRKPLFAIKMNDRTDTLNVIKDSEHFSLNKASRIKFHSDQSFKIVRQ